MANSSGGQMSGWTGWVFFAAFLILLEGIFQSIEGLVALFNQNVLVAGPNAVWLFNITTWGWTQLIIGIILILTGLNLFSGGLWGRSVGVILTFLAAIVNFGFIPVYPLWSIALLVVNGLVIYALVAHGGELKE